MKKIITIVFAFMFMNVNAQMSEQQWNYQYEQAKGMYRGEQYEASIDLLKLLIKEKPNKAEPFLYLSCCFNDQIRIRYAYHDYYLFADSANTAIDKYFSLGGTDVLAYGIKANCTNSFLKFYKEVMREPGYHTKYLNVALVNKNTQLKTAELAMQQYKKYEDLITLDNPNCNALTETIIPDLLSNYDELRYGLKKPSAFTKDKKGKCYCVGLYYGADKTKYYVPDEFCD